MYRGVIRLPHLPCKEGRLYQGGKNDRIGVVKKRISK